MTSPLDVDGWETNDPETTTYSFDSECLQTRMPDGLVIGWDTCGCGRSVVSCGCEVIQVPRYIEKMREQTQKRMEPSW